MRIRFGGRPRDAAGWYPLKIGAGGFVIGIDMSSDGLTSVVRTDVGGGYVRNTSSGKWEQLCITARMESASAPGSGNYDGVYEIRIAPSNSAIIYMVFLGWVWRSDDRGASWTKTAFTQSGNLGANNGGTIVGDAFGDRINSAKLAVDTINPDVVYLGTKSAGVYKTTDGGDTWTQISTGTIPFSSGTDFGHRVLVDPTSGTTSGRKSVVYASSWNNGLYKSSDGGGTWSLLNGSGYPTQIANLKIAPDGKVYCATSGGAIKQLSGTTWTDVSPNNNTGRWYNVITHPTDANLIIAVRDGGDIRVSGDAGSSYSALTSATRTATDIPYLGWTNEDYMSAADMIWDPVVSGRLWFAMGIGVFYADSISTSTTTIAWQSASADIEELVVNQITKPTGSNIWVSVWDRQFFKTSTPDVYPSQHLLDTAFGACWSLDYAPGDPTFLVALDQWTTERTSKSTDGGANWTALPNFGTAWGYTNGTYYGGHIAVSTSSNFVWCPNSGDHGGGAYYTTDGGSSWTACTLGGSPGATGWGQGAFCKRRAVDADKVTANKFYLFNSVTGFYRTTDGGATWTRAQSNPTLGVWGSNATFYHTKLRAVPGQAGHVFITTGADGQQPEFLRSTDSGDTFSAVSNVTDVFAFGFGKEAPAGSYPAIFIAGKVSSVWGMWRSDDNCATWTNIGTFPLGNFDFVTSVEGDPDTYGRCYVGFNGTGCAYYRL